MATSISQQQHSLQDYAPNSPPDQSVFLSDYQTQQTVPAPNGTIHRIQNRSSLEFSRHNSLGPANENGALPMQNSRRTANGGPRHRGAMSLGAFEGPKSPPSTKNTSHVPCKFFRSGQCQAGKACPFSHAIDGPAVEMPCKYFVKGNCKFGQKCALAHILPNGRRVNPPPNRVGGNLGLRGRIDPQLYQQSDPALAHSLLAQQANGAPPPFGQQTLPYGVTDFSLYQAQPGLFDTGPSDSNGYISHPDSKYDSPRDDARLAFSPANYLSVLEAPLPASFDSNGVSYNWRHGPVAASVPNKFGLESPHSSLPKKAAQHFDAVQNLQDSAFGGREPRTKGPDLDSSPLGSGDEGFGPRILHSQRLTKPKMISASLPRTSMPDTNYDSEGFFQFSDQEEEEYIPGILHDDLLSPVSIRRRLSRTTQEQDQRNIRESLSGGQTPADSSSKVSSPNTGSPSRFSSLFMQQYQDNAYSATPHSAFGHVGSPLRNSSLHPGASPSLRATKGPGDLSPSFPSFASPPRQSPMSILSQQLSRNRISSAPLNRTSSSSNMGRPNGRIAEEGSDGVFEMEEEQELGKRFGGGNGNGNVWAVPPPRVAPAKVNINGTIGTIGTAKVGRMEAERFWG